MHPLLSSPRKLLIALSAWLIVIFSFILMQKSLINAYWLNLTIISVPPLLLLFFILLSNYYIARAIKLHDSTLYLPVLKHVAAAGLVNAFWLQLSMIYSEALVFISHDTSWRDLFSQSLAIFVAVGLLFYFVVVLLHYLYLESERLHQLEQEALQHKLAITRTELNALKLSIHPHFLFNSFTALSALIRTDSEKAAEITIQLAGFLRQSLKYAEIEWTTVAEELNHISGYLKIEQTRLGNRLNLDFKVDDSVKNYHIPPFTLLPLIENAVKHGIEPLVPGGMITMTLKDEGHSLFFLINNPLDPNFQSRQNNGFGLKALKKRLAGAFDEKIVFYEHKENDFYSLSFRLPVLTQIP